MAHLIHYGMDDQWPSFEQWLTPIVQCCHAQSHQSGREWLFSGLEMVEWRKAVAVAQCGEKWWYSLGDCFNVSMYTVPWMKMRSDHARCTPKIVTAPPPSTWNAFHKEKLGNAHQTGISFDIKPSEFYMTSGSSIYERANRSSQNATTILWPIVEWRIYASARLRLALPWLSCQG